MDKLFIFVGVRQWSIYVQGESSVPFVAETGDPVPESQLKPVHSNYVPAQV